MSALSGPYRRAAAMRSADRRVRRQSPIDNPEYILLCRIGEAMAACLNSVSKAHMQAVLNLFDHLLHDPPGLWPPDSADDADVRWAFLRGMRPTDWLRRYGSIMSLAERRVGFDLFKRHVRYLSRFHGRVLHPDTRRYIPVPGAMLRRGRPPTFGYASSASFGSSSGVSEGEERVYAERREMLDLLAELRVTCCKDVGDPRGVDAAPGAAGDPAGRTFVFSPAEVRQIVDQACTTQEQLVVMLLLTTGMRIGGVARLRLPENGGPIRCAADVPDELTTVEKNQRIRRVRPTACVRVLLARWYVRGRRAAPTNGYVFPSPLQVTPEGQPRETHVASRHIWRVCRGLFDRIGLHGPHVHPHSFRHTVVQTADPPNPSPCGRVRGFDALHDRRTGRVRGHRAKKNGHAPGPAVSRPSPSGSATRRPR